MTIDTQREIDLVSLSTKLDYLVQRHEMLEDLIREMTPVAREVMKVGANQLAEWEAKGVFTLLGVLAERVVPLLETLKNLTEADVLAVANEAGDVIHHAEEFRGVGVMGAMRATRDREVQHGLAIAIEVLRHLGRERDPSTLPVPTTVQFAPPPTATAAPRPTMSSAAAPSVPRPDPAARVVWEGKTFTGEGFLVDPNDWSEDLATKMAAGFGIPLTEDHWRVLRWIRQDWQSSGASPNVRRTATGSGVGTQRMYELFPKTPGKTAAMVAGVPKPVGCV